MHYSNAMLSAGNFQGVHNITHNYFIYAVSEQILSSCHKFSMGFKSGFSGGVRHQSTPFSTKNSRAFWEVCLGSLSCMKRCPLAYTGLCRVGRSASCRIWMYRFAFIIPSNMQTCVGPCHLMPAQTCTLTGCFGQG